MTFSISSITLPNLSRRRRHHRCSQSTRLDYSFILFLIFVDCNTFHILLPHSSNLSRVRAHVIDYIYCTPHLHRHDNDVFCCPFDFDDYRFSNYHHHRYYYYYLSHYNCSSLTSSMAVEYCFASRSDQNENCTPNNSELSHRISNNLDVSCI